MQVAASIPQRIATVVPMTSVPLRGCKPRGSSHNQALESLESTLTDCGVFVDARELVPMIEGQGISVMSIVGNFDQVMCVAPHNRFNILFAEHF